MRTSFPRASNCLATPRSLAILAALSFIVASRADACALHMFGFDTSASSDLAAALAPGYAFAAADAASSLAPVIAWKQNVYGLHGSSTDATMNALVTTTLADVQEVRFDATYAYARITDVPSHSVGPFPGNPAYPAAQNRTVRIPRVPSVAASKTTTGNGPIGVMVNGVYLFNAADARTYNNAGVWQQNANVVEVSSFDTGRGHPAPGMGANMAAGTYHYHQSPAALIEQLDANNAGQHHSPLIGFAFDGFPIYGAYGYADPTNASSAITRQTSGYKIRDDVLAGSRNTLIDGGTTLAVAQRGPAVNATYPAGYYLQDYEWQADVGTLNAFNMRFTVTPEYPQGTWAYFTGASSAGDAVAYPYLIGPQYYGVVDATAANSAFSASATTLKIGDANVSGSVDFDDLLLLAQHYGAPGAMLWSAGDFDRNSAVNFNDLLLLAKNYTGGAAAAMADFSLAQSLVPEPALMALVAAPLVTKRRRSRVKTAHDAGGVMHAAL